jgi:hypothetical protein
MAFIAGGATGCTHRSSPVAATAISAASSPRAGPAPAPLDITLTGRVTEAPPTSSTGVWDAIVTLDDGVNTWRSAKTVGGVGNGMYSIPGLHAGRYRATVAADNFVGLTQDVTIAPDVRSDFQLMPVPLTKTITLSDHLGDHDGTCSDGVQPRPCHIVAFPVHNAGPIEATLTWQSATTEPVLNLLLFEKDAPTPLLHSTPLDTRQEQIASGVPGGAVYEIRIVFLSGAGTAAYSLRVSYPN